MNKRHNFEIPDKTTSSEYKDLFIAYNELEYKFGSFLCHVTHNMMSYTSYSLENMCSLFDELKEQDIQDATENSNMKLQIAVDALQTAYMSLADCASRIKAPEPYMLTEIKEALDKIEKMEDNE